MDKKEFKFKLKSYKYESPVWVFIRDELDYHIGITGWYFVIDTYGDYDTIIINNHIPEKHDSIINELILKYG